MRYKITKYAALILACCVIEHVQSQFMPFPGMGMMGMQSPGSLTTPIDTAAIKRATQSPGSGQNVGQSQTPEKPKTAVEKAIDTIGQTVKKDELELKRMNITASRLRVEKELVGVNPHKK
jgi:hypothetical protein